MLRLKYILFNPEVFLTCQTLNTVHNTMIIKTIWWKLKTKRRAQKNRKIFKRKCVFWNLANNSGYILCQWVKMIYSSS